MSFAKTAPRCRNLPCLLLGVTRLGLLALLLVAIQDHLGFDSGNIAAHTFHQLSRFLAQLRLVKLKVELWTDQTACRGPIDFGGSVGRGSFFDNVSIRVASHWFEPQDEA